MADSDAAPQVASAPADPPTDTPKLKETAAAATPATGTATATGATAATTTAEAAAAAAAAQPVEPGGQYGTTPSSLCIVRVNKDIKRLLKEGPKLGLYCSADESDILSLHALVVGPSETPYDGGLFLFYVRCPPSYPMHPPSVTLLTTAFGMVRFNPNLYANGRVCLSILGTWEGPGWSSAENLVSTLLSIQSLMNAAPYHNEPGFDTEHTPGASKAYNECIAHETLRVAVCMALEGTATRWPCPEPLKEVMREEFMKRVEDYKQRCRDNLHMDGKPLVDPFAHSQSDEPRNFRYAEILQRLETLEKKFSPPSE